MLAALPNLPWLEADETIYSWTGYAHAVNRTGSGVETCRLLFGSSKAAEVHDFPHHLKTWDQDIGRLFGNIESLALQRTMLGYFLAAKSTEFSQEALQRIANGHYPEIKFRLGLARNGHGMAHPIKGCDACIQEDERVTGRAFWHASHQFPSVFVCSKHRRMLFCVQIDRHIATTSMGKWQTPRSSHQRHRTDFPAPAVEAQIDDLVRMADFSKCWSLLPPAALDTYRLAATYRAEIHRRGWVKETGDVFARLQSAMSKCFGACRELPAFNFVLSTHSKWSSPVGLIVRIKPRESHPFKHLVLISTLFPSWSDFMTAYSQANLNEPKWISRACPHADRHLEFKRLVEEQGMSANAAARKLGMSRTTARRVARPLNLSSRRQPTKLTPERVSLMREMLAQGKDKSEICRATEISMASLNAFLTKNPELSARRRDIRREALRARNRSTLTTFLEVNPKCTAHELRSAKLKGMSWLLTHDAEWMSSALPESIKFPGIRRTKP